MATLISQLRFVSPAFSLIAIRLNRPGLTIDKTVEHLNSPFFQQRDLHVNNQKDGTQSITDTEAESHSNEEGTILFENANILSVAKTAGLDEPLELKKTHVGVLDYAVSNASALSEVSSLSAAPKDGILTNDSHYESELAIRTLEAPTLVSSDDNGDETEDRDDKGSEESNGDGNDVYDEYDALDTDDEDDYEQLEEDYYHNRWAEEPDEQEDQILRYEITHWPFHVRDAERLWTPEERRNSVEWRKLWELLKRFLCDSPLHFDPGNVGSGGKSLFLWRRRCQTRSLILCM